LPLRYSRSSGWRHCWVQVQSLVSKFLTANAISAK
jgi:hypothetical protein